MKGVGSHGSCKNYYKDFVIASADMPDVDTTDAYVQHMAVCNCISCPVWNYLHYSSLTEYVKGLMKIKEKMIKMQKNITNFLHSAKSFDFSN